MRVVWNSYEPPIPLDVGDDPKDYILELYRKDGSLATVKRTQFSTSGEVLIFLNGIACESIKPEMLIIDRYAIRIFDYQNDNMPSNEAPILSHEIKGKTIRLRVDCAC